MGGEGVRKGAVQILLRSQQMKALLQDIME